MSTEKTSALDARLAVKAHLALAGRGDDLLAAMDAAKGARIVAPATSQTIYSLESLFRLARDRGVAVSLGAPTALSAKEEAFFADFRHRFLENSAPPDERPAPLLADALSFAESLLASLGGKPSPAPAPERIRSALLIGAYGGEHVGDAAILGGVLLDLHKSFGVESVCVLSTRPMHTARLAASLETPVRVAVARYDYQEIAEHLASVDALAFAGGPLMDLPRMLVKHLSAARRAARLGKPFIVRRIGVGPFSKSVSRWTARQIALHASAISVRTSGAARDPIVADLAPEIKTDPAFDYLASRRDLTRLAVEEMRSVDKLLAGSEGRKVIGVNIRPIRHDWSPRGKSFAEEAESRFYDEAAAALKAYAGERAVTFVFFPMNPIQLGASDLAAAYRLHKLLGGAVDFRVWEADPDVDDVLYMLRKLDAAIAMRFHGAIFCLSQNLPTIGIDYYPGQGGKVEQLFRDRGIPDLARRIDEADGKWLLGAMRAAFGR
jgi:polysaccharide pyruvyl transferase WcaK-like protein